MSDNISFFSFCDSNFNVFDEPSSGKMSKRKNFLCKFDNCNKTFAHYSSRNRHYSKHHSQDMPPRKDNTTTNNNFNYNDVSRTDMYSNRESSLFNNNITLNLLSERNSSAPAGQQQEQQIRASPQIKEAINLCQSFFNRENVEAAISLIKGSSIVQENAVDMR